MAEPLRQSPRPNASTDLGAGEGALLNHLRWVALDCRAKARADLLEACALLTLDRDAAVAAHAEALMRCLSQALGRRATLFRPGTVERSDDEAWLLQLAKSSARGDAASLSFLLASRLALPYRRPVRFLIGRIAGAFALV